MAPRVAKVAARHVGPAARGVHVIEPALTVELVPTTLQQEEAMLEALGILVTWLLRRRERELGRAVGGSGESLAEGQDKP